MVHRGYTHFWRKRGMPPPPVSKERLEISHIQMKSGEGLK